MSNLLNSDYAPFARELLELLKDKDLEALVKTVSSGRITPVDRNESYCAILLLCTCPAKLLSLRKLNSNVLQQYLHQQGHVLEGHTSKTHLVILVSKYWDDLVATKVELADKRKSEPVSGPPLFEDNKCEKQKNSESLPTSFVSHVNKNSCYSNILTHDCVTSTKEGTSELPLTACSSKINSSEVRIITVMSDAFASEFCEWFYSMLNRLQPVCEHLNGDTFRPDIFCSNCRAELYFIEGVHEATYTSEGAVQTESTIREILTRMGLLFSPNTGDGVQAQKSSHGLVKIFCCGTLHAQNAFLGIFEQEFGLVNSPIDRTWKISYTKVNLKKVPEQCRPTLPKVPVFSIEY